MKNALIPSDSSAQAVAMGQQLTIQYDRAIGGLREVLIFGAMMIKVREEVGSACGVNSSHGPQMKGWGVKAWLQKYAPKVNEATAYRFLSLAEGARKELSIPKSVDLQALITTPATKLEAKLARKQADLFELIEGSSQRQLLLQFGRDGSWKRKYADTKKDGSPRADRRTVDQIKQDDYREEYDESLADKLRRWSDDDGHRCLDDARLIGLHGLLLELYQKVRDLKSQRGLK